MLKKTSLLLLAIIISFNLLAQDRIPVELRDTQLNINILNPSVSFEKRLSDKQSLTASTGFIITAQYEPDLFGEDFLGISLNPFLRGSFRNYYPRKRVNKELKPNSGNYVGLLTGYIFGAVSDNLDFGTTNQSNSFYIGPVWGIQRNYQSGIHLGLSLGFGFGTGKNMDAALIGLGQFQFGFVIK
ncbi:MAG: hypothetical protein O7F74_07785 [Bacteroidetes bacterium]|nr:hypothetical protein [Bacteroidota bacterium]